MAFCDWSASPKLTKGRMFEDNASFFRLKTKGQASFQVVAPKPFDLRPADTADTFIKLLKIHLFTPAIITLYFSSFCICIF